MSIGKGSINRAQNAEKNGTPNGAANILTTAPDMENSTPTPIKKKAPAKKTSKPKVAVETTVLSNPSPETVQAVRGESCPIGEKMPVHLL